MTRKEIRIFFRVIRGCRLLAGADLAGKRRQFGWTEGDVVFSVHHEAIPVELEVESRIERRLIEDDLDGEGVGRSPGATGRCQRIGGNGEDVVEPVSKQPASFGPRVCGDSQV